MTSSIDAQTEINYRVGDRSSQDVRTNHYGVNSNTSVMSSNFRFMGVSSYQRSIKIKKGDKNVELAQEHTQSALQYTFPA